MAKSRKKKADAAEGEGLNAQQAKALTLLLAGKSIRATARDLLVHESTVHRWMAEPGFKKSLDEGTANIVENELRRLKALLGKAVNVLEKCMAGKVDGDRRGGIQLRAAETVLKSYETFDLQRRVMELEAQARAKGGSA